MRVLARLSPIVAAITTVLLVLAVAWALRLQAELADRTSPSASPSPMGSSAPSDPEPSRTGAPAPAPTSGDDAVGGAVWYPPSVASAAVIIAAEDSVQSARDRADVVVSGSADDEINAALREVGDAGGGQVRLLGGSYPLDATLVIDAGGVALVGETVGNGVGYAARAVGSQLIPGDAFPDGGYLIHATPDAYGPMISLLHMDGLDRARGLLVQGPRPTVTLNVVTQSSDTGLHFAGESTGSRPYDGYVLFNRVFDGAGIGILHDELSGDMLIEGNVVFRNDGDGFRCYGASQMYRVNHAYNNGGVGLRLIPGCVRTRMSSNKWEGNAQGGVSIEGGSGFTIVGDTFAHNETDQPDAGAHLQIGVRGETDTVGVLAWGLSFGKGSDDNPHLIHVGPRGEEVSIGPVHSAGGSTGEPFRIDDGAEVRFYEAGEDPIDSP